MMTSNFANNQRFGLNGISISRYPDRRSGFTGPEFTPLMPDSKLLIDYKENRIDWDGYTTRYLDQLSCLNPQKTWDRLDAIAKGIGAKEAVIICYRDPSQCSAHSRRLGGW